MEKYFCRMEYEFEADSPEDAARQMFNEMEVLGGFDPTVQVIDAHGDTVDYYESSDFAEPIHYYAD